MSEEQKIPVELTIDYTNLPPNWEEIQRRFPSAKIENIAVAYGNRIYVRSAMPDHLLAHEMAHCERQGFTPEGAKEWWDKYLVDNEFLKNEEVIAYRNQLKVFSKGFKDRNNRVRFAAFLAKELSGDLYGNFMPYSEAFKLISS